MEVQSLIDKINREIVEELSAQDLIKRSLIPQGIEIPMPDIVFGINDIPVFTKKSISTLIGRAKSGKTTVTSWVVSQLIKSGIKVLWIDTEQGLYYGSRTQHWVLSMSNLQTSTHLQFYDLKTFNPSKRVGLIELMISNFNPDLVVVDGIRDLVFDINNPEQATIIVGELMRWADHYDCHILNILHQNKGNDHARGHLGTEMINKSESVIKVEVNDGLIVCSPEYTRSKAFDVFAFGRNEHGMPVSIEGYVGKIAAVVGEKKSNKIDPTDTAYHKIHPEIVAHLFSESKFLTYSQTIENIRHYFKMNGVNLSDHNAREFRTHYLQVGMILKDANIKGNAKYYKHPKFDGMK